MEKIAVFGIGPVGSILSAHLIKAGKDVLLVDILKDRLLSFQQTGLNIKDPKKVITGDFTVYPKNVFFSAKDLPPDIDIIFISTKTYSLEQVISEIAALPSPPKKVVIFQNGLDNEKLLLPLFGPKIIYRSIANYGGVMTPGNEAEITFFNRPNFIAPIDTKNIQTARELAALLTGVGIETEVTDDLKRTEWEKAILNSCLAPISAVTGLTMKEVMDDPELNRLVSNLLREGVEVGEKAGIRFAYGFFDRCMSYLSKGGYHKPSMQVDIERGHQTEIDFLNGRIIEYGDRLGLPVPYHKMITGIVRGLEKTRGKKKAARQA